MFLGDVALNGPAAGFSLVPGLERLFKEAGAVVCNLEGAVAAGEENPEKEPRVFMGAGTLARLAAWNVRAVSLANNHAADGLRSGFDALADGLRASGIGRAGAGTTEAECREPYVWKQDGITFGMLAYVDYGTHPNVPDSSGIRLNFFDPERAVADVRALRAEVDHVIVQYHGGKDFSHYPSPRIRAALRSLVDAGASLVAGHHPHVIQGWERHGRGYVFYSCGNFMFNDIVFNGKTHCWARDEKRSLVVVTDWSRETLRGVRVLKTKQRRSTVVMERMPRRSYRSFAGSRPVFWHLNLFYVDYVRAGWLLFFRPGKNKREQLVKLLRFLAGKAIRRKGRA